MAYASGQASVEDIFAAKYISNLSRSKKMLLTQADREALLKVMTAGSVETSNLEMLAELVSQGKITAKVLKNICDAGTMDENVVKDLDLLYDAYINNIDPAEVFVKTSSNMDEALSKAVDGDVFEIAGEKNIYIKTADKTAQQLKISKETYMKLFPPVERYTYSQGSSADCYLVSAMSAMMDNPKSRINILSSFTEDGENVLVKLPKGTVSYIAKNGELGQDANLPSLMSGSKGFQLLEHVYGYNRKHQYVQSYTTSVMKAIDDTSIKLQDISVKKVNCTDAEEIAKLVEQENVLNGQIEKYTKLLTDVVPKIESGSVVIVRNNQGQWVPVDINNAPKFSNGLAFKSAEDYYRGNGGLMSDVYKQFGFDKSVIKELTDENDQKFIEAFSQPDFNSNYILGGGTKKAAIGETLQDRAYSIYSSHAYKIVPEVNSSGELLFKVTNPWNGTHNVYMTYDKLKEYFRNIYIAKID